jgi:hypothetical protein
VVKVQVVPGFAYLRDLLAEQYETKAVKECGSVYVVFQVCNPFPSPRMWLQTKNARKPQIRGTIHLQAAKYEASLSCVFRI